MITQEELKRLLTYDKETGLFKWNISKITGLLGHCNLSNHSKPILIFKTKVMALSK